MCPHPVSEPIDDVSSATLAAYAAEFAGNHLHFDSFYLSTDLDDPHLWGIYHTHHRDSGIIDLANAKVIEGALGKFEEDECIPARFSHWAVGWIEGYIVKVWTDSSKLFYTDAFVELGSMVAAMQNYPLLDEDIHSQMESEALDESITDTLHSIAYRSGGGWRDGDSLTAAPAFVMSPSNFAGDVADNMWQTSGGPDYSGDTPYYREGDIVACLIKMHILWPKPSLLPTQVQMIARVRVEGWLLS